MLKRYLEGSGFRLGLFFKQFDIGPMQNFGYLIGDDKTKEALIVDPAWAADGLLKLAEKEGYKVAGLVITHAHYDHTNAIEDLLGKIDVPVYANENEITYAKSGNSIVGKLGRTAKGMKGGEEIKLGDTVVSLLHTPGHTPGSQCLRVGKYLVTGDTLFVGGCGRSDLPGGDAATLFKSLQKIAQLPSDLTIYPGHDYGVVKSRSLQDERADNPYLKMKDEEQFLEAVS